MVTLWPPMLADAVLGGLAGARRGGCCARSGRVMAAKRAAGARTATGLRKRFMESVSSGGGLARLAILRRNDGGCWRRVAGGAAVKLGVAFRGATSNSKAAFAC